jgi:tyrosyl-tRNA synthetase
MYLKSKFPSKVTACVLLADEHARLNMKGGEEEIEEYTENLKQAFTKYFSRALPKTKIVVGSEFQNTTEYGKDVRSSLRKVSFRDLQKSAAETVSEETMKSAAWLLYPVMQALDMKYLKVDIAVGGMDQRKVHVLARELLPKVGWKEPVCIHTHILSSLEPTAEKDKRLPKMSKSKPERAIFLDTKKDEINQIINDAFCPPGKEEPNPIKELYQHLFTPLCNEMLIVRPKRYGGTIVASPRELIMLYEDKKIHPKDFKSGAKKYLPSILHSFQ